MKGWAMRERAMPPTKGRSSRTGARLTRMMVLICTVRMRTAITGVMFTAGSTFSLPAGVGALPSQHVQGHAGTMRQ